MKEGFFKMFNAPRNVALLIGIPCITWLCISLGFYVSSFFPPDMVHRDHLTSKLYWVGQRSFSVVETEVVHRVDAGLWKGKSLTISVAKGHRTIQLESSALPKPVVLTYDGMNWRGYTHIPKRSLPVVFEVR